MKLMRGGSRGHFWKRAVGIQLISLDLEQSVGSVWFVRVRFLSKKSENSMGRL